MLALERLKIYIFNQNINNHSMSMSKCWNIHITVSVVNLLIRVSRSNYLIAGWTTRNIVRILKRNTSTCMRLSPSFVPYVPAILMFSSPPLKFLEGHPNVSCFKTKTRERPSENKSSYKSVCFHECCTKLVLDGLTSRMFDSRVTNRKKDAIGLV